MAIRFEVIATDNCSKMEPHLRVPPERHTSQDADDEYEYLEVLDTVSKRERLSLCDGVRNGVLQMTGKWFGERKADDLVETGAFRILDKISYDDPDSKAGGAPIKGRIVAAFMKLGRGIPYKIVRKQEIETEIKRRLGQPIQGHKSSCECLDCGKQRTAVEAARRRVYRAVKLRQELGYPTRSMPLEQWETHERFGQLLKRAQREYDESLDPFKKFG